MTWSMHQTDCKFRMPSGGLALALAALQKAVADKGVQETSDFADAMRHCSWSVSVDPAGHITGIFFEGQNWGEDEELFDAIAPWVEKESFIEMRGEDGDLWRWIFDGKAYEQVTPETVWPARSSANTDVTVIEIHLESGGGDTGVGVGVKVGVDDLMWYDATDGFITHEEELERGNGFIFDSVHDALKRAQLYISGILKEKGWK